MGYRATVQIFLIVVSVTIVFTYIKPTFEKMQNINEEKVAYQSALDRANAFNQELGQLLSQRKSFTENEMRSLMRYVPDDIDEVAVMRDLETIVENQGMVLVSLAVDAEEQTRTISKDSNSESYDSAMMPIDADPAMMPMEADPGMVMPEMVTPGGTTEEKALNYSVQKFSISVVGTYEQFKLLLQDIERNVYTMEPVSVSFTPGDDSAYTYTLTIETYGFITKEATL